MALQLVGHNGGLKYTQQQRIQKLVEQYKVFREIFNSNQEINQDFEILESLVFESPIIESDPPSWTLSNLMLICQRDGIVVTLVHILRGIINLSTYWKEESTFKTISSTLSTLIRFTRFVRDFGTKDFTDIEILTDGAEQLVTDADNHVKNVCSIFKIATNKIAFTTDAIEKVFPSDDEHRSRLEFGIRDLAYLDDENASVLSEQAIVAALRCSFTLILSYHILLSSSESFSAKGDEALLICKVKDLQNNLVDLLSKCETASEAFKTKFQECLDVHTARKITTTTVKGIPIPRTLRFSAEVKLYENTMDMINELSEMTNILQSIRSDSVKIIMEKSTKEQEDSDDGLSSSNPSSSSTDLIANLQNLQDELHKKLQRFNTFEKLENQIVVKLCSDKSHSKTSFQKCPPPNDHQDVLDESVDENNRDEVIVGGEQCIYYAATSNETDFNDKSQEGMGLYRDHEGVDELFELITCNELEDQLPIDNHEDQIEDTGVMEARQVVLEQLKTVLKPRHDMMKSREEEAYKRAYGERTVPEEEVIAKKKKRTSLCTQSNLNWEVDPDFAADDDDGDEIEDQVNENNLFSTDFKSRLDLILKKGAGSSY